MFFMECKAFSGILIDLLCQKCHLMINFIQLQMDKQFKMT